MGKRKWKAKRLEKKLRKTEPSQDESKKRSSSEPRPVAKKPVAKNDVVGVVHDDGNDSEEEISSARKLAVKKNKSGGFPSMGLSYGVLKGITRRGYKIPTPIQRKTIPIILEGKDVVAMARTGSGKTAAFLIPMFEKLKAHSSLGARAVIMSPTRELALQTLKFAKEIGKYTGLKAAVVLGGDKMDDQFAALHENPDIIIATPGRFLHILVEMEMKLAAVEYVVFDEADRLFEMGFQDQLQEIIHRFSDARQTVLFSATLPKSLVDFARAGLTDPTLIRLDVDTKLSEQLKLSFFSCRDADKCALLVHMLKHVIKPTEQTVVFAATKHHVEYLHLLLTLSGISATYIYSSLDQTARKINAAKFSVGRVKVLIVTDLAARGIDIPLLDNVINFHFPARPKLFVHRVGRVARAGRSGVAYSFVSADELAHLVDLHMFLGRSVSLVPLDEKVEDENGLMGEVPQSLLDDEEAEITQIIRESVDLTNQVRVCDNSYKKYFRSRPAPAHESIKRVKAMAESGTKLGIHPLFCAQEIDERGTRLEMLNALKNYKPKTTIFEINSTSKKTGLEVMKAKREQHEHVLASNEARRRDRLERGLLSSPISAPDFGDKAKKCATEAEQRDIDAVFGHVLTSKSKGSQSARPDGTSTQKSSSGAVDKENYIQYRPSDFATEKGLSVFNAFEKEAVGAILDLTNDEADNGNRSKRKWDRKRKKFVTDSAASDVKKKKIKTESGNWIPASYKSNAYKDWRHRTKFADREAPSEDEDNMGHRGSSSDGKFSVAGTRKKNWHTKGSKGEMSGKQNKLRFKKGKGGQLRNADEILKNRSRKHKIQNFQKHRQNVKGKGKEFGSNGKGKDFGSKGKGKDFGSKGKGFSSKGKGKR